MLRFQNKIGIIKSHESWPSWKTTWFQNKYVQLLYRRKKTEKSCCGMFLVKNCTISHFQKKVEFNSLFMTQMSQLKDHMRQSGKWRVTPTTQLRPKQVGALLWESHNWECNDRNLKCSSFTNSYRMITVNFIIEAILCYQHGIFSVFFFIFLSACVWWTWGITGAPSFSCALFLFDQSRLNNSYHSRVI